MPEWAQTVTEFNPIKYFVEIMRMVMLKGSGFRAFLPQLLKIVLYAIVMNRLAIWSYRITT
ncbi:MAG: ABC-2 type transport system permease protein [Psychroserpens sp.]|jgi:ABC-2 type transport system permease protein